LLPKKWWISAKKFTVKISFSIGLSFKALPPACGFPLSGRYTSIPTAA
jgi:hypothetical protein